jgi:hypothetical protein
MIFMNSVRLAGIALLLLGIAWGGLRSQVNAQEKSSKEATKKTYPAVPSPELLLLMVRTTIIGIDQANKTGNYAVLRKLGGPGLQALTPEQLAQTFAPLRLRKIDLAPAAIVTPQLSEQPIISQEGLLNLSGFFPTQPLQIQFRFVYEAVGGAWRPYGLSVSLVPFVTPALPPANQAPANPPK